jgi:hypothetical protein
MNAVEQPHAKPLLLRPWVPWLLIAVLVMTTWAFVDNVIDREWFLAGCFGVMTLGWVVQLAGLLWTRRRAHRQLERGSTSDHRS